MIKKIIVLAFLINAYNGQAQVYFSENFNDGNSNGWINTDNDSDNPTAPIDYDLWYVSDQLAPLVTNSDSSAAISHSQAYDGSNWVPFSPNNFLISPPINLTSAPASNLKLKFDAGSGQLPGGHAEQYAVYVTTSSVVGDIELATPVFQATLPVSAASNMESHVIDISAYAGSTVYVTIRHFNTTNQFALVIDNIIVETPLANNASIESLKLNRYSLTNTNNTLDVNVKNEGVSPITAITIDWNDGVPHTSTITGLNIAPFATDTVSHPIQITYPTALEKMINVSIMQVNGVVDADSTGNLAATPFNTISIHVDKKVVFEEGTGTSCPPCPGGTVMMKTMFTNHPNDFIGISVHVNDPMAEATYQPASGFAFLPTFHADRKLLNQNIANSETVFLELFSPEIPVSLATVSTVTGSNIVIDATATFNTGFANSNFRLGVVVTEDSVTGTGATYAQANAYSGGGFGAMGGFENLPDPVPANQMVYDNVARALLGGYDGQVNSVPTTITTGQVVNYSFNYNVPVGQDINKLNAVLVLIDQSTGEIIQANASAINMATGINKLETFNTSIYPNPAKDNVYVNFQGGGKEYLISIFDITGKEVISDLLQNPIGDTTHKINIENLKKGIYFLNISTSGKSSTTKIIIQ